MFKALIEADWAEKEFDDEEEFEGFVDELAKDTIVQKVSFDQLTCLKCNPGDPLNFFPHTSTEKLDELSKKEFLLLNVNAGGTPVNYPLNMLTTPFTLEDRIGSGRRADDMLKEGLFQDYSEEVNSGLTFYSKVNFRKRTEVVTLLVRAGIIIAVHTGKYNYVSQDNYFSWVKGYMKDNFATSKFLDGYFNPERTVFSYRVCASSDPILASYSEAWKKAGFPEPMLKKTIPVLEFSTGDTGKECVSCRPVLRIGRDYLPLGTTIKIKHSQGSSKSSLLEENVRKGFSALQEGLTSVKDMISLDILHPYACFVKAATKAGIPGKAKRAIQAVLDNFKDSYAATDKVTAFDIYSSICSIQYYDEFNELSDGVKLSIFESFNRLIQIDWAKLDGSGREDF